MTEQVCIICGTTEGVETWVSGPYHMPACVNCGETAPSLGDGFGNRPVRLATIEAHKFSEGVADLVKILSRGAL